MIFIYQHDEQMRSLLKESKVFGIALFGNGATIQKAPMMIFLGTNPNNPFALLDIVDCTSEMAKGVLGRQANLRESSKSKELAQLRLQVFVVVKANDACESKKEIMRLKRDLQCEGPQAYY